MGTILDNIKYRFKQKDILIQLIIINVAVFLILAVIGMVGKLFKLDTINLIPYIAATSDLSLLVKRPWTLFTYMIVHIDFLHILFNMLMLFWFGQMFLSYFSSKNLGSLYLLGGLAGAVLYIITFNTIPYYLEMNHPPMIGASASVMAIIFAAAFYRPNAEVNLFMVFRLKIIYIAIFLFVIDFISLDSDSNPGGHIAHIGGAIMGYIFAKQYLKGKDITRWVNKTIDSVVNLTKPGSSKKMKVKYKKTETDYQYNQRRHKETEEIDRILDKIKASGYSSLSTEEKKRLFDASKK
ncbi:rhomboid family intramembrane serine protease [Dysgonomonas sp. 521]|uniref:rhomboid family intramembrane serine protease n=1 Tax=Dysgonomonas sp. 521 TaxID=2302932 RepID=UPI0013CFD40F|nr:rhomboid family intramembrane serine protease [Dysgonomonas sp. 521]NDV96195.1 rhomboid family intramembrane serine protease [Dysgonomonas sp. 521]